MAEFNVFAAALTNGKNVTHKIFGRGTVVTKNGKNVTIRFGHETKLFDMKLLFEHRLIEIR